MTDERARHTVIVHGTEVHPGDDRQRYREKIARITLDSMVQFVGLLDAQGTVLEINKVALDAVGIKLSEVEGRPFWTTFWWQVSEEVNAGLRDAIARAARGESVRWDAEIFGRAGGKETIIIDASLVPVRDDDGRVVFICAEGRDITEKKANEREIARQREELAQLDKLKTQFFANVSHEFRTPLTLMMGPLEDALTDAAGLSADNRDRLELAHRNSLRLLKLVNTLLDFSRIEAGRIEASYEPTDLSALTRDLASVFRSAVERAGLRLVIDCPPLPQPVYVDREMWEKIVLNLVSNAFKFTFDGEIEVALRQVEACARLTVRDSGTGIPAEELPRLFERFHRVKGARGRSFEGSGIGLALVQELARLHGGTVEVESDVDRGSTFSVTIPLGKDHLPTDRIEAARSLASTGLRSDAFVEEASRWLAAQPPGTEAKPAESTTDRAANRVASSASNRALDVAASTSLDIRQSPTNSAQGRPVRQRILFADDNADMREYVLRLLVDYDVEAVADGQAALRAAGERPPDLVLTDVMMPGLDGFALLREFRADPRTQDVPVILLSARAGEESRIEGMQAGADDYLAKPFSAKDLLARVQAHLHLAELRRMSQSALRASEARYRAIVEATPECVMLVGSDGTLLQMNSAGLAMVEGGETMLGQCVDNFLAPEFRDAFRTFNERICRGERGTLEFDIIGRKGTRRHMETTAVPLPVSPPSASPLSASNSRFHQLAVARDVTVRRGAEAELLDIRSRMEAALAAAAIGTWSWDVREDRFFADSSLARIFSLPPQLAAGAPLSQIADAIHLDDRPRVEELVKQAVESGHYYEADYRIVQPDGTSRWVTARGQVERDEQGRAVRFPGVVIDVTDRKHAEEQLVRVTEESERRKRLYETILSATPDFIYVFSLDYRVLYANDSLVAMWGAGNPVGKTFLEIGYEPWHAEMHAREIDEVRATKKPIRGEVPFTGTYGKKIYDYIFVPVFGTGGEVEAVAGTTRDVTDRKAMEEELRLADRRKDEFLAMLAHELRNPLAPIRSGLEILSLAEDSDNETLHLMQHQVDHLVRLVDDLLDVSRIVQGKIDLRREPVDVAAIIQRSVEVVRQFLEQQDQILTLSLPVERIWVQADAVRLTQVLDNLLNNACKYTQRGGRIEIGLERQGEHVLIRVRDNGMGIEAGLLPRIFDLFTQADRTLDRARGGLGIGLTLVRRLVELHGGTIAAESGGLRQGSEFVVKLPTIAPPALPLPPRSSLQKTQARRILVVDDNVGAATLLARLLSMLGNHDIERAHEGLAALSLAAEFHPEIILLDIGLPDIDGYEVATRLRKTPEFESVLLVALTGYGQEEDRRKSREAGFDVHLVKPPSLQALGDLLTHPKLKDRHVL